MRSIRKLILAGASRASRLRNRRRVPVINQLSLAECGVACLAMILNYFGRQISLAECRLHCGLGRDGVSAGTLSKVARRLGLRVKAYSLQPSDLQFVPLPAIAHWTFNHYVVIEKWSPHRVEIVDPAAGRRTVTAEEFNVGFTGVVLAFEAGSNFKPVPDKATPYWIRYLKSTFLASGAWSVIGQILVASLLLQSVGLGFPVFTKIVVDQILPFKMSNIVVILAIGMLIVSAGQGLLTYLRSLLLIYLRGRLDSQLMHTFFEHLLRLPFRFFQQRPSGDLLMRLGSNSLIREMLTNQTLSVILDGSFMLVYLLILLFLSPTMSTVVVSFAVAQIGINLGTRRRVRELAQRDIAAKTDEQSYLVEAMKGIPVLKASGAEGVAFDRWSNLFVNHLNVSLQRNHLSAIIDVLVGLLRTLTPLMLLWFGATRVLEGSMTLGGMLAFNALAVSFLAPLAMLLTATQQMQMVGAQLDRVADVLDAEPEQPPNTGLIAPPLVGHIELRNVSFRYEAESPLVLRDLSCTILAGQKVALVGPTGSGKSTLAMVMLGLYPPTAGEILYDGMPLQDLNLRSLRSQFGVVLQETFLFSGSIKQNITLNKPDTSFDELIEAARIAGIHEDILKMPMGYESLVAEGGMTLSGGERQRLSIARALINRPAILVLDEATSNLDMQTEGMVDRHLSELSCSRIVIAHRLSTVRNADQILVLNEGKIVERGSHDTLMERNGHYAALVQRQMDEGSRSHAPHETRKRAYDDRQQINPSEALPSESVTCLEW